LVKWKIKITFKNKKILKKKILKKIYKKEGEGEMATRKNKRTFLFLKIFRWLLLALALLFFLWLAKNLGWLKI